MNSRTIRIISLQILILLGISLGAINWYLRPEAALLWLVGMLTIPISWAIVTACGALNKAQKASHQKTIYNSLIMSGLIICAALAVVLAEGFETIPEEWPTRFGMLMNALILIIIGNGLPKKIEREPAHAAPRTRAIQRLLGWTFVVTGILASIIWLTLPIDTAEVVGLSLYACAIAFAAVRIRLLCHSPDAPSTLSS